MVRILNNRLLINRLSKEKAKYYDINNDKWVRITPFLKNLTDNCDILINNQKFKLQNPDYDYGYFYGIAVGSSYSSNKQFILVIEPTQIPFIKKFSEKIGVKIELKKQEKKRKTYRKKFYKYYQKFIVKFPNSFKKYLKCIGLNIQSPQILQGLSNEVKMGILSGLFSSKKAHYVFNNRQGGIREFLILRLLNSKIHSNIKKKFLKSFLNQIKDILFQLGIKSSDHHEGLLICGKSNLTLLFKHFKPDKVKSLAMATILELRSIEKYYTTIINLYPLEEFDLTIWGYSLHCIYHNNNDKIPYTLLEQVFKVGSNEIRRTLYKLSELGILEYFARGRKEFISNSMRVINLTKKSLESKYNKLKNNGDSIILECPNCLKTFNYLLYFENDDFKCPECNTLMNMTIIPETRPSQELRILTKFINSVLKSNAKLIGYENFNTIKIAY